MTFSLAPYIDAHCRVFPGSVVPAGRYGKAFKRLESIHGSVETLRRWEVCLARKKAYATPEELGLHWSDYDTVPTEPEQAIVDAFGCFTEYGERITRPRMLR